MTGPWRRFPDVQAALVTVLAGLAGGADRAGVETPPDLEQRLPFICVTRIGGASTDVNDYARVQVDVLGATYAQVEPLAERVRQFLTGPPIRVGPAVLDRVSCDSGPHEAVWSPTVRRMSAVYLVVSRRHDVAG